MAIGFTEVQTILDAYVDTLGLSTSHQYENTAIKTANTPKWFRTMISPATTVTETIGVIGQDRINGIYIVDLFYPINSGTAAGLADTDTLVLGFETGKVFSDTNSNNVLIDNVSPATAISSFEKYYMRQVVIAWRAYRQRSV